MKGFFLFFLIQVTEKFTKQLHFLEIKGTKLLLVAVALNLSEKQLIIFGIENLSWTDNERKQERKLSGQFMFRREKLLP